MFDTLPDASPWAARASSTTPPSSGLVLADDDHRDRTGVAPRARAARARAGHDTGVVERLGAITYGHAVLHDLVFSPCFEDPHWRSSSPRRGRHTHRAANATERPGSSRAAKRNA